MNSQIARAGGGYMRQVKQKPPSPSLDSYRCVYPAKRIQRVPSEFGNGRKVSDPLPWNRGSSVFQGAS